VTADTVVRLLPPLIMTPAEGEEVVSKLAPLVREFLGGK
jgi:acetylornithine aminotransferase